MAYDTGFQAIPKANQHNLAITANTDILSATIAPSGGKDAVLFRLMVAVDTAGVFTARITKASVIVGVDFYDGNSLVANALYIFDLLVHSGDTVNFRHSATGNLLVLRVQEVAAAVT